MRRLLRMVTLGLVLAVAAVVVPNSTVASTQVELVKVARAQGVDREPEVVWILAVGSDARPGESMLRTRGDALQLVGINTRTGAATTIGIPRDSYVPIRGAGSDRVNAALYYGGPQLLGETVGDLVGVQPDYVFVTRFPFFEDMVDDIGGIEVRNPRPFSDVNLKADGFKAGKVHLNGYGAMAFARIRKTLPGGDFDRSANQQRVLRGIHGTIRAKASRPGFIEGGVQSVMEHMHTDLPPGELFALAQAVAQVEPGKITGCVVQGAIGNVGGASVVLPYVAQARRYGDLARKDATIERC
ncbi:LCP family protein [Nocardioides sp. cx-173]|uniref:LCP family protein n=1 Tax=Nocardioides sp. cx-173 TaxID=2898796 RepID=UPI001E35E9EC|nr:LCP family protein [Nocardioides sp. cx-173]MCD4526181.1 LCP family protein [Nocardioides sp. cx-173]UGB40604.1 LCP family protein [Nocardioides sp. cx-173]